MKQKKRLAVEIVWSELLLCGGEWKTRKQIYEELLAEGHERHYIDWYVFCLGNHQPKEHFMQPNEMADKPEQETVSIGRLIYLISQAHGMGKKLGEKIARGTGGREIALAITKLEEARNFAKDAKELLQAAEEE